MTQTNETFIDAFLSYEDSAGQIRNEDRLLPTFRSFLDKIEQQEFCIDKTGVKTVEELSWQCKGLNPWQPLLDFNGKKTSKDYCKKELLWYLSQDLHVDKIGESASIWLKICSKKQKVNSNYGWCIFSDDNFNQYDNVLNELLNNKDSRRATMIFTRPSMWQDHNHEGMSDFICTWGTHVFIRNDELIYLINQRSCDIWFGLRNDFVFHCFVYQMLFNSLIELGIKLNKSYTSIIYNCDTIHLYERHFDLCKSICQK